MDNKDGVILLVQENQTLKRKSASDEDQFCQIARFLGGDARDVTGTDKSIAGFVEQEFRAVRAILAKIPTTKDGVLIYPGCGVCRVWDIEHGQTYDIPLHYTTDWWGECDPKELVVTDLVGHTAQLIECYSTLEEAQSAIDTNQP